MSFPPDFFARPLRHTPRKPWKPLQQLAGGCRWLVARVPRGLTWAGLAALGWLAVAVGAMAWLVWPLQVGWFTAGVVVSAVVCLPLRSRRLAAVEAVEQRFDAYRLADARTDLDTVGPVTAQHVLREPADGEAIESPFNWGRCPIGLHDVDDLPCDCPQIARVDRDLQLEVNRLRHLRENGVAFDPVYGTRLAPTQVVVGRSDESTGPAWVTCGRCAGRGWFDAVPAQGLRWMQCPECSGAGGQWRQP